MKETDRKRKQYQGKEQDKKTVMVKKKKKKTLIRVYPNQLQTSHKTFCLSLKLYLGSITLGSPANSEMSLV